MDKKVWAIVAIIALHLGLMWFLRGSLKPEELSQAAKIDHPDVAPIEPNPYLAPTVIEPDRVDIAVSNPSTSRASRTESKYPRKTATMARAEKPLKEKGSNAFSDRTVAFIPPVFNDTVIVVKNAEVRPIYQAQTVKLVEPRAVPLSDIKPIEKRKSFFRRAGTVVRKPYDWIKTLVSKL